MKFQLAEQCGQCFTIRITGSQGIVSDPQGKIIAQRHQPLGEQRLFTELLQLVLHLAFDFIEAGQQILNRTELGDKLDGRLLPDSRHPRHVVGAIAGQRLHFHHLVRGAAEALLHLLQPEDLVLHGIEHAHPLGNDLHQILVARNDGHLHPFGGMLSGQRSDDIIGLVALNLQRRQVESPHQILDQRNLRHQVLRHRRAVGLVFGINLLAEGRPPGVKHHRQVIRRMLAHHLEQHVGKTVHGIGRHPLGIGQVADGEIGAVDITRTVDQVEAFGLFGHAKFFLSWDGRHYSTEGDKEKDRLLTSMPH